MKDTIYTIPLTDAFKAEDECPFCFIHRKLEQDQISFTLGVSYMEDDIREVTDRLGFCKDHYKKLYEYGNRLGMALILQTHYQAVSKQLDRLLANTALPKVSLFKKLSSGTSDSSFTNPTAISLNQLTQSCYICERIDQDMERYLKTFFYLITSNSEFKALFEQSHGFCLEHFALLLEKAPLYLNEKEKAYFLTSCKEKLRASMDRISGDLGWFIDKYDYRNADKPMGASIDAIPRGIQKLSGTYVSDVPFKKKN
ncbi:MAG: DUF6062 family protein [Cellulosilyticaceae bacterium]